MKTRLAMSTPPTEFDRGWADLLVGAAVKAAAEIGRDNWVSIMAWLKTNRSDVVVFLGKASREVDDAVLCADSPRVVKACEFFVEAYRRAFYVYSEGSVVAVMSDDQLSLLAV